jgi:hypothetical protein
MRRASARLHQILLTVQALAGMAPHFPRRILMGTAHTYVGYRLPEIISTVKWGVLWSGLGLTERGCKQCSLGSPSSKGGQPKPISRKIDIALLENRFSLADW